MATLENDIKVAEERIREMEKWRKEEAILLKNMQKQENHFTRRWQRAKQI